MGLITSGQSFTGKVGDAFSRTPASTGTITSWAASNLPDGLAINATSGLISGTPTAIGNFSSQLRAPLYAISIASGASHALALKSDGALVAWGNNFYGQTTIPSGLSGVRAIAAAHDYSFALKNDGTLVAWGRQLPGMPDNLSGVSAIAAGFWHWLTLMNDGTVVGWGNNTAGERTIPSGLSGVTAIAAGFSYSLALKNDGTVVAWGRWLEGQTTIPPGLSGVTAIAAGAFHALALKSDGTVVGWGSNANGQRTIPSGLSGVTAIAAAHDYSFALKNDGTLVAWGENTYGQTTIPSGLSGVTAISAGGTTYSLALKNDGTVDGTVVGWGINDDGLSDPGRVFPLPQQQASIAFTISEGVPIITASQTLTGAVGTAFNRTPALTDSANRPVTSWAATGLPAGLSINASTGAITGSAPTKGIYTTTLSATGPGGTSAATTATISIAQFISLSGDFSAVGSMDVSGYGGPRLFSTFNGGGTLDAQLAGSLSLFPEFASAGAVEFSLIVPGQLLLNPVFSGTGALDASESWNLYREIQNANFIGSAEFTAKFKGDFSRFAWGEFDLPPEFDGRIFLRFFTSIDGQLTPSPIANVGVKLFATAQDRLQYREDIAGDRAFDLSITTSEKFASGSLQTTSNCFGIFNIWSTAPLSAGSIRAHIALGLTAD